MLKNNYQTINRYKYMLISGVNIVFIKTHTHKIETKYKN